MVRTIGLLVGLLLITAACSGDSGRSGGEQALADAIRDSILEDNDPTSPFGEAEATCIGETAVDELGVDGLLEIGITESNADPGDAFQVASDEQLDAVIDVTLACIDFRDVLLDTFLAEGDISDDSATCLADELDKPEILRPMVEAGLRDTDIEDDPEAANALFEAIFNCLSIEELGQLGGE